MYDMYLHVYKTLLPFALVPSVTMSYLIGMDEAISKKYSPQTRMLNTLGIVSLGTFIGLAYPISAPFLAGRYLYRDRIV